MEVVLTVAGMESREQKYAIVFIPVLLAGLFVFLGVTQSEAQSGARSPENADVMAALLVTTAATLLSLVSILLPATALLRDRSRRTSPFFWSRPVSQGAYVLGRFLGSLVPCLVGAVVAVVVGAGVVAITTAGSFATMFTSDARFLALYGAQVLVAIFYPATLTFCFASLSGSEELAYTVGVVYWLAARLPLGNAWMINFATVFLGGSSPAELHFSLLGGAVLLNRLFHGILPAALLIATVSFHNRSEESCGWLAALSEPLWGWTCWLLLGLCGVALVIIIGLVQQTHLQLPPAWQTIF